MSESKQLEFGGFRPLITHRPRRRAKVDPRNKMTKAALDCFMPTKHDVLECCARNESPVLVREGTER